MKAQRIAKLRKELKVFYVAESYGLFGDFNSYKNYNHDTKVLARNPKEALKRYFKRRNIEGCLVPTTEKWAGFRVIPEANPYPKFITYWD